MTDEREIENLPDDEIVGRSKSVFTTAFSGAHSAVRREQAAFREMLKHYPNPTPTSDRVLDVSRTLKVSRSTVERWINGISTPHPLALKAILSALTKVIVGEKE